MQERTRRSILRWLTALAVAFLLLATAGVVVALSVLKALTAALAPAIVTLAAYYATILLFVLALWGLALFLAVIAWNWSLVGFLLSIQPAEIALSVAAGVP